MFEESVLHTRIYSGFHEWLVFIILIIPEAHFKMPSDPPPPYQPADASGKSNLQATAPQSTTQSASAGGNTMQRSPTNMSEISHTSSEGNDIDLNDELRDMDDEQRDLPPGWVRCFDPNQKHHFYVDEATKRSTWVHPYDDPEFLRTLPKDHPAHPDSKEARAVRKQSEDEELSKQKRKEVKSVKGDSKAKGTVGTSAEKEGTEGERNWFQRKKDKMIGTKEEREKAKAEKRRLKEEQKKRIQESRLLCEKDILLMTSTGARRSIPQETSRVDQQTAE
ncbi:hypothetical protein J007_04557 [Cryptococcus neoformans]|nr:hypothetical protein J007_04557 [Cryptococcus neoformans var. grubii]OXC59866.1 hypothetical protein C358_04673 [Cryptococcus neoformans var. grubii MW-RSA852]